MSSLVTFSIKNVTPTFPFSSPLLNLCDQYVNRSAKISACSGYPFFFIRNHFQKYLSASKTKSPITLDTLLGAPKSAISLNAQYSALQKESLENFVGCWARHDFFDQNDIIAHEALRLIKLYKIIHKDFLITILSSIYQSDVYGFLLYSSIKDFLRRNQIKDFSLHSTSRSSFRIF